MNASWRSELDAELDAWQAAKMRAEFWWRDDDAQAPTPHLDKILALAQLHQIPLGLAVIPEGLEIALETRLRGLAQITVLQHGYAHRNHAPPDQKKAELGNHRAINHICAELQTGFTRLQRVFGERFVPILVPPWNRIAPELLPHLNPLGFGAVSAYGARIAAVTHGLRVVNTHLDIINWKQNKTFVGTDALVSQIIWELRARRLGYELEPKSPIEPLGILSHHLVHPPECTEFLAQILPALTAHPAVRWHSAEEFIQ